MDAKIAPAASLDARTTTPVRAVTPVSNVAPTADKSKSAVSIAAETLQADLNGDLAPAHLLIEIDKASGRFVNTLLDPDSKEVLRQFPSNAQLAYSRAVTAYMRAMSEEIV